MTPSTSYPLPGPVRETFLDRVRLWAAVTFGVVRRGQTLREAELAAAAADLRRALDERAARHAAELAAAAAAAESAAAALKARVRDLESQVRSLDEEVKTQAVVIRVQAKEIEHAALVNQRNVERVKVELAAAVAGSTMIAAGRGPDDAG